MSSTFINYLKVCKKICSLRQTELEQNLEKVQKELEQIKEQQNHQKLLADSAIRQRDMYRILLQTAGVELPPQGEKLQLLSFIFLVYNPSVN